MTTKPQVTPVTLGILSILASSVLFAPVSQTATKYLASDFPLIQIVFFRSLGQTLWMVAFFWPAHGLRMFKSAQPGLQFTRSTLLFVSSLFWVSAVAVVPLTTASAINFTAPMMVVMMSVPLLGERVGLHRWGAVCVGFIGALVVIRPVSA
jgi:drug/metabolite transporter (DMT)-like permease